MDRQRCRSIRGESAVACLPMLLLAHEIAGRLRFVSPALKGDRHQASRLERQIRAVPGVTGVEVRHSTGSLIVLHDGAHATRQAILRSLAITVPAVAARCQPVCDELGQAAVLLLLRIAARRVLAALL